MTDWILQLVEELKAEKRAKVKRLIDEFFFFIVADVCALSWEAQGKIRTIWYGLLFIKLSKLFHRNTHKIVYCTIRYIA